MLTMFTRCDMDNCFIREWLTGISISVFYRRNSFDTIAAAPCEWTFIPSDIPMGVAKSKSHWLKCEQPLSDYPSGIPHVHQRRLDEWMGSINSNDAMWNDMTPDLWQEHIITQRADSLNHSHHALDGDNFVRVKELLYIIALWNIFLEYFKSIILLTDLPKDFTFIVFLFLFSKTIEIIFTHTYTHALNKNNLGSLNSIILRITYYYLVSLNLVLLITS